MEVEAVAEEAAGARKRKRDGGGEEGAGAKVKEEDVERHFGAYEKGLLLQEAEDADEEGIAEEAVAEVMRWLEAEISSDHAPEGAPGFVTINGNEESCGPSFSCAASTVMASVDTRAGAPPPPPVPWPFPPEVATASKQDAGEEATADEAAWLAELLACGPALRGV